MALTAAALFGPATTASAAGPQLLGAGSTWVGIAMEQWASDAQRFGVNVDYSQVGSGQGRQLFSENLIDFAGTEIPFQSTDQQPRRSYQYIPDVGGGTSFMYNVTAPNGQQVRNLQLSSATIAKIFTGQITNWDNPAITADNGGHVVSHQAMTVVVRADSSGTSAQLSYYLAATQPSIWGAFAQRTGCAAPCQIWPQFSNSAAQTYSSGVANFIANPSTGQGAIGYVEAGYALQRGYPVSYVRNASGNYVLPTSANVATALSHAVISQTLTAGLAGVYSAPQANAYPVSSYSLMITPCASSQLATCQLGGTFPTAKGAELGKFVEYVICAGQNEATPLGYTPIPKNLVLDDYAAIKRIPGAPPPPPLSQCANPTLHGSIGSGGFTGGSNPQKNGGQATGSSGGGTTSGSTGGGGTGTGTQTTSGGGPSATSGGSAKSSGNARATVTQGTTHVTQATVAVQTSAQRTREINAALASAAAQRPPATRPLAIAAALVLVVFFVPQLWRRRRRGSGGAPPERES